MKSRHCVYNVCSECNYLLNYNSHTFGSVYPARNETVATIAVYLAEDESIFFSVGEEGRRERERERERGYEPALSACQEEK